MADIFISYSRRDSEQAVALAERLRASGANVWMDTAALTAAETWSAEIVNAIEKCTHFFLLLSGDSVASSNVTKEVSLASEAKKTIIPIEIHPCELNAAMKYALAGLQKVSLSDEVALVRAFEKLGIGSVDGSSASLNLPEAQGSGQDARAAIRIAVLPFEDQSPAHDNEWFSDGLTDELISTLGKLDQLFVIDSKSSGMYKGVKLQAKEIARQLGVRYIVYGAVRKAGEKIRIHATLIDTSSGVTLWDEKFNGTMEDIFEIQEKTAIDITHGLKLKLTKEEVAEIEQKGTDNPEAYELYLRAISITGLAQEDLQKAIDLNMQAIALDPHFVEAYAGLAVAYANYYRNHGRKPETLQLQREAAETAQAMGPENIKTYNALANLYSNLGDHQKAIDTAKKMVTAAPHRSRPYSVVGFMYMASGNFLEGAHWYEQAVRLEPSSLLDHNNVTVCYYFLGDTISVKKCVVRAQPYYEQYLALQPDDQSTRINYMIALEIIGQHDQSIREAERLLVLPEPYGYTFYQVASIYSRQGDIERAATYLRMAAERGIMNFIELRTDKEFFGPLHALPDFEALVTELELLVAKANG
jgi:adenylate cyclase